MAIHTGQAQGIQHSTKKKDKTERKKKSVVETVRTVKNILDY
jgi:hypothetical protein